MSTSRIFRRWVLRPSHYFRSTPLFKHSTHVWRITIRLSFSKWTIIFLFNNRERRIRIRMKFAWTITVRNGLIFDDQAKYWTVQRLIWISSITKRMPMLRRSNKLPCTHGAITCSRTWIKRLPMRPLECWNEAEPVNESIRQRFERSLNHTLSWAF